MNKKIIIGLVMASVISLGAIMSLGGGVSYAESVYGEKEQTIEEYSNTLVKDGILTADEANHYIQGEKKLDDIYAIYDEATEDEKEKLDTELDKIMKEFGLEDLYDKIDSTLLYRELEKNKILTPSELNQYKLVNDKLKQLYKKFDQDISEDNYQKLANEETKILESNKVLLDKVEQYFIEVNEQTARGLYDELSEFETWENLTTEERQVVEPIVKEIQELSNKADGNPSDADMDMIDKRMEELYLQLYDVVESLGNL